MQKSAEELMKRGTQANFYQSEKNYLFALADRLIMTKEITNAKSGTQRF